MSGYNIKSMVAEERIPFGSPVKGGYLSNINDMEGINAAMPIDVRIGKGANEIGDVMAVVTDGKVAINKDGKGEWVELIGGKISAH